MSFIPYVIEQTIRGERSYDIYSRLLKERIIEIDSEKNAKRENEFLFRNNLDERISNIFINSNAKFLSFITFNNIR